MSRVVTVVRILCDCGKAFREWASSGAIARLDGSRETNRAESASAAGSLTAVVPSPSFHYHQGGTGRSS